MSPLRVESVRELRSAELAAVGVDGRIEFRIQRVLRSPNTYLGMHWREKNRERKAWMASLSNAVVAAVGISRAQQLLGPESGIPNCTGGCTVRRRVEVTRFAPTRRNFVRDDDNLRFAVKPVLDALKHLGLIRDDHRKWIELALPTQELSTDGTFWTWIAVGSPEV